jgi:hypothetical protein
MTKLNPIATNSELIKVVFNYGVPTLILFAVLAFTPQILEHWNQTNVILGQLNDKFTSVVTEQMILERLALDIKRDTQEIKESCFK